MSSPAALLLVQKPAGTSTWVDLPVGGARSLSAGEEAGLFVES